MARYFTATGEVLMCDRKGAQAIRNITKALLDRGYTIRLGSDEGTEREFYNVLADLVYTSQTHEIPKSELFCARETMWDTDPPVKVRLVYTKNSILVDPENEAIEIISSFYPDLALLKESERTELLLSVPQLLGANLIQPSEFMLVWFDHAMLDSRKLIMMMELAKYLHIPILNLRTMSVETILDLIEEGSIFIPGGVS